jgi:predicted transcriptional regulator
MRLKDWLRENGLKHQDFAEMLGVVPSTVSHFIGGRQWPSRWYAKRIFELTNGAVTPNDFLDVCEREVPQEQVSQRVLIKDIAQTIAAQHGMSLDVITGTNHSWEVARVRHQIYHTCVVIHGKAVTETGRALNRNHASIRYGIARHAGLSPSECRKCKGSYPSAFYPRSAA